QAATSAGTARAEAPGLSEAREKAGAVPAKSVRRNGINGYEEKWTFSVPSSCTELILLLSLCKHKRHATSSIRLLHTKRIKSSKCICIFHPFLL
ncbi:hypothetical protein, partial [Kurthia sibirica]